MRLIDGDSLHEEISKWPESVMYKDWVQSAIANAPTIAPPPNAPLTISELREMDGEAVWSARWGVWGLVDIGFVAVITRKGNLDINDEGIHERLYRRKPEEETI